ncbi:sensor histidine kinase [Streptomyces sp. NPDC057638]|uniref:sensor histidine kinase n=1 Tax=Streptomyces sp. NPDC057638 TaxID=3346190 RepID=UPI003683AA36
MNRPLTELVFDHRYAGVRALVYAAVLLGDFLLVRRPTGEQDGWLAAAALVLCLASGRWILTALVAQSALLVLAHALGTGIVPSLKTLAAVTLFELAVRHAGRLPLLGGAVLALALAVNRLGDLPGQLLPVLFKMGVVAGLPLLLGSYVRMTRETARYARIQAEQRARAAEHELAAARAAERTAIARDLHDLVAHHVSSMVLRVGVARHVVHGPAPAPDGATTTATTTATATATAGADARIAEVLDDLHSSGHAALADLRRLVAVLRTPGDPETDTTGPAVRGSLPGALEAVAERGRRTGLDVTAVVDPAVARLDGERALAVLRLAQEGLANAVRHAGPGARAELRVVLADDSVRLTVHDDGAGQPPRPAPGPGGHGLTGMRERAALLGGRLEAGPSGRGWLLTVDLPTAGLPPRERP